MKRNEKKISKLSSKYILNKQFKRKGSLKRVWWKLKGKLIIFFDIKKLKILLLLASKQFIIHNVSHH